MKKIIFLVVLVTLLCSLVLASSQHNLQATLQSQDPDPVEPGQIVKVKFKIENQGGETTEDVIVKITPKFPFTIYDNIAEKNIGKLRGDSTGADAAIVEFRLKVDENAVEEDAELELLVGDVDGAIAYIDDEFLINIQTHDAVLDIVSITSEPEQVASGETAEIKIMVKNVADSLLKDIKFKLGFSDDDIPLAPYQSSSERRISQLKTNYQNSMVFKIIADPEAVPGLYKVPLNISYNDEKGNSYQVEDILAVKIGDMPQLVPYIKKSTVLQAKNEGKVTIEIANAGTTDIKFLELILLPSDNYQLITTSNYFYLGDVDSDDTESEEIDIYINRRNKVLKIPIMLKYYDANNKPYQQGFDLELNLYSSYRLKKFGILERSKAWMYLLILILVGYSIFLYRKYKKDPEEFSRWLQQKKEKLFKKLSKVPLVKRYVKKYI